MLRLHCVTVHETQRVQNLVILGHHFSRRFRCSSTVEIDVDLKQEETLFQRFTFQHNPEVYWAIWIDSEHLKAIC